MREHATRLPARPLAPAVRIPAIRSPLAALTPSPWRQVLRQERGDAATPSSTAPAEVSGTVQTDPGTRLDPATRGFFEPRLGLDLGGVRVHAGSAAGRAADAVDAHAFTVGRDIFFGAGQFEPRTDRGRRLLAHELVHVAQQARGAGSSVARTLMRLPKRKYKYSYAKEKDAKIQRDRVARLGLSTDALVEEKGQFTFYYVPLEKEEAEKLRDEKTKKHGTTSTFTVKHDTITDSWYVEEIVKCPEGIPLRAGFKIWSKCFGTKKEADALVKKMKALKIEAEVVEVSKKFGVYHKGLSETEAQAEQAKKTKEHGTTREYTLEHDKATDSWRVKETLKCPEAIPNLAGYTKWKTCFATKKEADALVTKMKARKIDAKTVELTKTQHGVYYKPYTEAKAKTTATAEAKARKGHAEGMYEVEVTESKDLDSWVYDIKTVCPTGYTDLGDFQITTYSLAQEKEFPDDNIVKDPCGLKGKFRWAFLSQTSKHPRGVKMQGSGKSIAGQIIQYDGATSTKTKDCFTVEACPKTASTKCATVGTTVAVDTKVIKMGSELLIEDYGPRTAEDTGGSITGKHIDNYVGDTMTMDEANRITHPKKKVCKKK